MAKAEHELILTKTADVNLNVGKMKKQIKYILDRGMASNRRSKGWDAKVVAGDWVYPDNGDGRFTYTVPIRLVCKPKRDRSEEALEADFEQIVRVMQAASNKPGWTISSIDGSENLSSAGHKGASDNPIGYAQVTIPAGWPAFFKHIYDLDSQIELAVSCLRAGIESEWRHRFHCALVGPPAVGKTTICRAFKEMLGEEAVVEYDATALTQAGLIKDLRDRADDGCLPRVALIEEIEKTEENVLRPLLAIMDDRAEIRKVTYRDNFAKEARLFTIATVNDIPLFKKVLFGTLASRFCYHIEFPPPNRALLEKILRREVKLVRNASVKWIEPAILIAEELGIHDPRKVTAMCLAGGVELMDGTYQEKLRRCMTVSIPQPIEEIANGQQ